MKYLISGVAPGFGGVGKLMEYLEDRLDKDEYILVYPLNSKVKNRYIRGALNRIYRKVFFKYQVNNIKNKNIILMHHQTLGLNDTLKLIQKNSSVDFYIMDNAFFCLKSYNYIDGNNEECLKCVGGKFKSAIENNCQPFPIKYKTYENITFLENLRKESKKINFYTLSHSNAELIKAHFGKDTNVKAIYFLTNDLLDEQNEAKNLSNEGNYDFDIVYHGADVEAKGFKYVQELSKCLNNYKILIPTSEFIESKPSNLTTKYMTWETGLKETVINSKLVLTPSLWSNTPEAATLKSFLFNGSVALVENRYGFSNDIPEESYLRLTGIIEQDVQKINEYLSTEKYLESKKEGRRYIDEYITRTKRLMGDYFKGDFNY